MADVPVAREDRRPGEPAPLRDEVDVECDWGGCDRETVAVRWNDGDGFAGWLPVCAGHALDGFRVSALVVPLWALRDGGDGG